MVPPQSDGEELRDLDRRVAMVERQIAVFEESWKNASESWKSSWTDRISGGASREISRINRELERIEKIFREEIDSNRKDIRALQDKTTRWEGAGHLVYWVATASGLLGALGAWFLDKLGAKP